MFDIRMLLELTKMQQDPLLPTRCAESMIAGKNFLTFTPQELKVKD